MKVIPNLYPPLSGLAAGLAFLGSVVSGQAASANWNPLPTNNNWIAAPTTNNWSTGPGTYPGSTSGTASTDIATFNTNSTITTINCASGFVVGGFVFDTTNASAYTINTSGGTWRLGSGAFVRVTGPVLNRQTITGSLRLASSSSATLVSDAAASTATLNITTGASVNNSGASGTLILTGTNTGPNTMGAFIEQSATILGTLIKSNTGTWFLTGNSTIHSNAYIFGGTLELVGAGALPNCAAIVANGGALTVSNTMTMANSMFVTNAGALVATNTTVTQSPVTVGTLTVSNAAIHLGFNGGSPMTGVTVTSALNAGPNITLAIDRIVNLSSPTTFTLISYAGSDPDPADFAVTVPFGYTAGSLAVGGGAVTVLITPPVSTSLVWVGATNSVLVSNWETNRTKNWLDQATLSIPQFYANPDSVQFDDTAANGIVTVLTTNTPNSVGVNNYNLNYTFNGPGKISGLTGLQKDGGGTLTLAESGGDDFQGGILVNGGTLILDNTNSIISGGLTIYGTAQIGQNDGGGALPAGLVDDEGTLIFNRANGLTIATSLTGGGALTQNGNGTLTLSNTNTYTGLTAITKGTLALTGIATVSNSYSLLVSNATFDVSGISGTTLVNDLNLVTNATLTLGVAGLQAAIFANTLEVDGITAHSNTINLASVPGVASYPAVITLIKSANGINLAGGHFNFALGSLPAATPAYAGALSESDDQTAVQLILAAGPLGQRSSVTWAGIDNTSVTTNWSDRANWQLPGAPGAADNVIFDGTTTVGGSTTVNNFVDNNFTVASLTYDQTISGQWHVTQIPAGMTLTVNGATTVGGLTGDGLRTSAAVVDAGTLVLNNNLIIGNTGSSSSDTGTILDLSGLSNFVFNASSGVITMGTGARSGANLILAGVSNNLTVGTINANTASASGSASGTLSLGPGTNILNVGAFNAGAQRSSCTVQFTSGAASGGLRLRGSAGTEASRATMVLGNRNTGGSSGTTTGNLSLNGFPVDLKLGTLTLGQCNQVTPVAGSGILQFDTGTLDATTINLAVNSNTGTANGAATVGANATLVAGVGGISMVNQSSTGAANGTLTVNGGTVICSNSLMKTTASGIATVTFNGGTLNMVSGTVGTLAQPIDSLTLNDGTTLQLGVVAGVTNIAATSISASGAITIKINSFAGLTGTSEIPLIYYGSGDPYANLVLASVPSGYVVGNGGVLVDNTANQTIDIIVTPPAPIIWQGAVGGVPNSSWDTSTLNWLKGAAPIAYADVDFVQFDDTASSFTATLAATVSPGGLIINDNVHDYTFNGGGKISGTVGLVKEGSATLILDNSGSNDFTGGVNLAMGTLQIGNNDANGNLPLTGGVIDNGTLTFNRTDSNTVANLISGTGGVTQSGTGANKLTALNTYSGATLISAGMIIAANANSGNSSIGSSAGAVVVTNGGTLDLESPTAQSLSFTNTTDSGGKPFFIAGAGVGGNGAIVNNGTVSQEDALQSLTLTANATVGGPARWDLRVPDGKTQPVLNLAGYTLTKTGSNQMSMVAVVVTNGGNIVINSGVFSFETISSNATTAITINAGGVMGHYRENAGFFTAPITLNGGMIRDLNGAPGSTNDSPITLTANSYLDLNVGSTDQLRLNGVISESGGSFGLTKTNVGAFSLAGVNTYSGATLVAQGTLTLANNGSISQSRLISVAANATLDASQRVDQTLTLADGQTLAGSGTVMGAVVAGSGSTVAPGSAASVGTLTFAGNLTLGGATTMKLTHVTTATNDGLNVAGSLAVGGTLNVSLLGSSFAAGDTFTLFSAAGGVSGTFAATNLPVLGGGLGWDTTNLVNGVLHIIATVNPSPTNLVATVAGNTLSLTWPADHTGWRLLVQTNTVGAGLNPDPGAWFTVPGSTSVNSENINLDPTAGTVFYRMALP